MVIRLEWTDPGCPAFHETDEDPNGHEVFATWPQAKEAALDSAIDNREQWAKCARDLRKLTMKEALT